MMNIGIVCEGPTDYVILKYVIDHITGENNVYQPLQPEPDLSGAYGNGWKGVLKWCRDNADIRLSIMKNVEPVLDVIIFHLDGDVSRREKPAHCVCSQVECSKREEIDPLTCDIKAEDKAKCPVHIPCPNHPASLEGYISHLRELLSSYLKSTNDTCFVIPCDSIEAWIVAAYDNQEGIELVEDPWNNIIAKRKTYHDIRIAGKKKHRRTYEQFALAVCANWSQVTKLCCSAREFEKNIQSIRDKI